MPGLRSIALTAVVLTFGQEPEVRLGNPTGIIAEPYSDLFGLAELPDGRVIVADRVLKEFSVADFRAGSRQVLGRNGPGPNEYQSAFGVIRWRGDTLLGYDATGTRLVRFTPAGTMAGSHAMALPGEAGGVGPPRSVDRAGNLYWDTPRVDRVAMKRMLKARILRWMPGQERPEVVAEFTDHTEDDHHLRYRAMPRTDAWAVTQDGRVAILSATEYRLRWLRDGRVVDSGPPIPFNQVPVTAAERDAFREQKSLEGGGGASIGVGPGASAPRMSLERVKAAWPDSLFPRTMPPFEAHAMLLSPNGDFYVGRTGAASESVRRVDVLDESGRRRATIRLPEHSRLVGLGVRAIYVLRFDDDGLQTLQRFAYPILTR